MTLFWSEYIAPKLDAADLKEVQKCIPILNTQDVINCSHSFGVFDFEGRPTTQENGPTAGVFFMAQNLLRRCRGIYTHINKVSDLYGYGNIALIGLRHLEQNARQTWLYDFRLPQPTFDAQG